MRYSYQISRNTGSVIGFGSLLAILAWFGVVVSLAVGWVINIFKLLSMDFDAGITVEAVLRIVGLIVAPLGGVMGLFF